MGCGCSLCAVCRVVGSWWSVSGLLCCVLVAALLVAAYRAAAVVPVADGTLVLCTSAPYQQDSHQHALPSARLTNCTQHPSVNQ